MKELRGSTGVALLGFHSANGTGQIWLLQALYLLSGYKTPVPLVMRAGNSSGSDPPHREIVPQQGRESTESPLKHLPHLISACSHSPCTVAKDPP